MKYLVANWKMNGDRALVEKLVAASVSKTHKVILCPPYTLLHQVKGIALGAQDCSAELQGAYTGDISAVLLKEAGCEWVILGHSERRQHHQESDALIARKLEAAVKAGLSIILCVGESSKERSAGQAETVVKKQLSFLAQTSNLKPQTLLIAYEPVWAIGTGETPTAEQIKTMHHYIQSQVKGAKVLYGGSVKPSNINEIMAIPGVDGVLVGGASLEPESWRKIVQG